MKITHFLYIPFTGLGLHNGYRGEEWLKNRIALFKQFVVPSLLNQTNQNFILWISWRSEEEDNPIVDELRWWLDNKTSLKSVFTFNGLCFWDDKYPDKIAEERLNKALLLTLPQLKDHVANSDLVYMTIQPSDDIYINTAVDTFQSHNCSSGFGKGYIINYATKELAEYNPETQPPFYTIFFTKNEFLDSDMHPRNKSHEYINLGAKIFERGFIVGTHGENISTVFNHPYKGRVITGDEKKHILEAAGILDVSPLVVGKSGMRLLSRKVLNALPFNQLIRKIYHKLPWQIF